MLLRIDSNKNDMKYIANENIIQKKLNNWIELL